MEDSKNLPKTLELEPTFPCYLALKKMGAEPGDSVILAPGLEVNAIMKQVPERETSYFGRDMQKTSQEPRSRLVAL